jgi:cytochrome c556
MRFNSSRARRIVVLGLATAIGAGAVAVHAEGGPPSPGKQAVHNRRAVYHLIGSSFRYLGAVAKGDAPYDGAEAMKRAQRILFLSGMVEENFPEGSNLGEPESKAKAEAWSNRADFNKKFKQFAADAATLAQVTAKEKGATEPFRAAVAALGQDCKSCHETYKIK